MSEIEADRGREAQTPSQIPPKGWLDILWRLWRCINDDRVLLIAAGAAFYLLLALFPALAAFVSVYGFVADPVTIADHVAFLGGLLPREGLDLIRSQLESLAGQEPGALGIGFFVGLAITFWSANSGIKTLFEALNVAYREREKRSFLTVNLMAFAFTFGAIAIGILMIVSVGVAPLALKAVYLGWAAEWLIEWLRWPVLLVAIGIAISILYRFGPSREHARWRWITWGSAFATLAWVAVSAGFSWYLQNFADYNATYGSLGAVIGLMLWIWISVIVLLVGAELNAEMEHQTARDSTTGPELPMGERGAVVADQLGETFDEQQAKV